MAPSKFERLKVFYLRVSLAAPASNADEAIHLLRTTLDGVEDELSGIPYNPDAARLSDGRMYPPQDDSRRDTGNSAVRRYRSAGHNTFVGQNGAIRIETVQGAMVEFEKPGIDGRNVSEL